MTARSADADHDVETATTAGRREPRRRRRRILTASGLVVAALIGYTTWTNVRAYRLQASIDINATPQQVWAVLSDLPHYGDWNPFIVSSSGDLRVGSTLTNKMHDATGDTTFTPTVEVVRPGQELRWIGKVGPGMVFDGEHTFTLQALGAGRTRLNQQEDFTGVAVPFFEGRLKKNTFPQFQAMNAALARVAESR
jgi:hypothetical protein